VINVHDLLSCREEKSVGIKVSVDVGRLIHYRKRHNLSQYKQEKNFGFLAQANYVQQRKINYVSPATKKPL